MIRPNTTYHDSDSVLGRRAPETKDVPDDAVVPQAYDEVDGKLLSRVTAARASRVFFAPPELDGAGADRKQVAIGARRRTALPQEKSR